VKNYVVAVPRAVAHLVPGDWQQQVCRICGLSALGSSPTRLRIQAEAQAIQILRQQFGNVLLIEEVAPRQPATP
jgi:hypothetical protein